MNYDNIPIYILAGGQSCRMGSDKLFEKIGNNTLLEKTLNTCLQVSKNVTIVAKEFEKFEHCTKQVLIDDPSGDGPIAGIITALKNCSEEYCFITAADFYDLHVDVMRIVMDSYQNEQFLGLNINNRLQPLLGIYQTSCLSHFLTCAESGSYKILDALKSLRSKYKDITLPNWRNVNSPEELKAIRISLV